MTSIRALIVDDEDLARKNLEVLLHDYCPQVRVLGAVGNAREARRFLADNSIDVMFLDIEMPNGSGFELLESLADDIDFRVVFTTAYHEHALRAFRVNAADYILKPINPTELEAAMARVAPDAGPQHRERVASIVKAIKNPHEQLTKIALPTMEGLQFVAFDDIAYCESHDNYTQFHLVDGKRIMVSKTIKFFEDLLDEARFFRIHRSNIINLKYIERYVKGEGGYVVLKQGARIPVSRRRKDAFLELFGH